MNPGQVLTAVFFDIPSAGTLGKVSALLGPGSTVFYDAQGQPALGIVGGEWAYKTALSGAPLGATEGISSSGFSGGVSFGPPNLFPGADLQPPTSPDGVQYGILSAGDNTATGNTGITGSGGLIKNQVVITLSGLPGGFDPSAAGAILHVSFQYGTALTDANVPGEPPPPPVPEPATLALLGVGLLGISLMMRRRRAP